MHHAFFLTLVIALAGAVTTPVLAFQGGDYYRANTFNQLTACSHGGAIHRIDPQTYAVTQIFVDANGGITLPNLNSSISYDPYRDRIVMYEQILATTADFSLIDEAGVVSPLPDPTNIKWQTNAGGSTPSDTIQTTSARDGRIFVMGRDTIAAAGYRFQYWDANDNLLDLMDQSGSAAFVHTLTGNAFGLYAIYYDSGTNALFVTEARAAPDLDTRILKIPLSVDGTQVSGAVQTNTLKVSVDGQDRATQWSEGPGGKLMLYVNPNSSLPAMSIQLVDPISLATEDWATPTNSSWTSGLFEPSNNTAVVRGNLDLREFQQSGSGDGALLAANIFCHSGTSPFFVRIDAQPPSVPSLGQLGITVLAFIVLSSGAWIAARRQRARLLDVA